MIKITLKSSLKNFHFLVTMFEQFISLVLSPLFYVFRTIAHMGYYVTHRTDYKNFKDRFENDFGNTEKKEMDIKWIKIMILSMMYSFVMFSAGILLKNFIFQILKFLGGISVSDLDNLEKSAATLLFSGDFYWYDLINPKYVMHQWKEILSFGTVSFPYVGLGVGALYLSLTSLGIWRFFIRNKVVFGKQEINKRQLGTDRLARINELLNEYKIVPDSTYSFKGYGGTIITHVPWYDVAFCTGVRTPVTLSERGRAILYHKKCKGWYLIDDTNSSTSIIGMTRAGKGEKYVIPQIDLYSRALLQSSLIIHDMKRELADYTAETLKKRGYDVHFINVMRLEKSASYNPLYRTQEFLFKRNLDKAQKDIYSLAFSIYEEANFHGDRFFIESPQSLLSSIILLMAYEVIRDHPTSRKELEKLTLYNAVDILNSLGGSDVTIQGTTRTTHELNLAFEKMRGQNLDDFDYLSDYDKDFLDELRELAFINYGASKFASENSQGNIFSSTATKLKIYLQKDVALMTSKNDIDLSSIGFPRMFSMQMKDRKKYFGKYTVKFVSEDGELLETLLVETDKTGFAKVPYEHILPKNGKIVVTGDQLSNDGHSEEFEFTVNYVQANGVPKTNSITGEKEVKNVVVTPLSNESELEIDVRNSIKPVALFLISPDYDRSYNQILSFIINQAYTELADLCFKVPGGKTYTRVQMLLDEFGNLPAIPDMGNKATVALGKNILFSFAVQEVLQYINNYGEEVAEAIQNSCSNTVYLLSPSEKTAEKISKKLGYRTVKGLSTSNDERLVTPDGKNHNATVNNSQQSLLRQELLTPTQLMRLVEGEAVIIRANKQHDKKNHRAKKNPIFNNLRYSLPSSFMFLKGAGKTFDYSNTEYSSSISEHMNIELMSNKVVIDVWNKNKNEKEKPQGFNHSTFYIAWKKYLVCLVNKMNEEYDKSYNDQTLTIEDIKEALTVLEEAELLLDIFGEEQTLLNFTEGLEVYEKEIANDQELTDMKIAERETVNH